MPLQESCTNDGSRFFSPVLILHRAYYIREDLFSGTTLKIIFDESFCVRRVLISDVSSRALLVGEVDPATVNSYHKEAP